MEGNRNRRIRYLALVGLLRFWLYVYQSFLMSLGATGSAATVGLDQRNSIASIRDDGLGMAEKPDYVTVQGAVTYIRHDNDPWYAACPNPGCNKKV